MSRFQPPTMAAVALVSETAQPIAFEPCLASFNPTLDVELLTWVQFVQQIAPIYVRECRAGHSVEALDFIHVG